MFVPPNQFRAYAYAHSLILALTLSPIQPHKVHVNNVAVYSADDNSNSNKFKGYGNERKYEVSPISY